MRGLFFLSLAVGCSSDGTLRPHDLDVPVEPEPAPPEPEPEPEPPSAPALVVDDLHVAGVLEELHAFALLAPVVNPVLTEQITNGTLLLGLELRGVDDPELRSDDDMSVGMYALVDRDGDPTDNFDADAPETFDLAPGALVDDEPALHFVDATLTDGVVEASGLSALDLLEGIPLPLSNLSLSGELTVQDGVARTFDEGRLRGAVGLGLLALTPNPLGENCDGATLLDVLATGCGLFGLQPDEDVDGDGLERLFDDDGDGQIDRCVDGDGTEILGVDCPQDPGIVDGYTLVFVITGVRAELNPPS